MKTLRLFVICGILISPVLLTGFVRGGEKKKPPNDLCAAGNAQSICSAANTCGSASSPCQVDIRRDEGDSSSATPAIPGGSKSKNTGFVLDFGNSSPFATGGVILGGADRPVSVVAKKPGCYTYSIGACTAGTIYGIYGEDAAQFAVSAH